jgi:erythromycin esterase
MHLTVKISVLGICLLLASHNKAQVKTKEVYSITSLTADEYKDLAFLKKIVADKKIVLLGESSHGIGDYYSLKARLIKYLHQECGFEVLALESGIADIFLEYQKADTISAVRLRNNTVYGNFQCAEIMPLFDYIKQTTSGSKPLIYSGFDSQNFSASLNLTRKILTDISATTGDSIVNCITKYYRIPSMLWQEDRSPLFQLADSIKSAASMALTIIRQNKDSILTRYQLSPLGFRFLERALQNHRDAVSLDWNKEDPVSRRDSLMAANLFWLMNEVYPNKKVIVWAHNGHTDRSSSIGNPYKWMGHYVSEKFGIKSFHIGLYAKTGQTYEWWTKTNKPFNNNKADDVENLSAITPITFLLLNSKSKTYTWTNKQLYGYEVESGGRIQFIPYKRFDAIITIKNVKLPTYK